MPDLAATYRFGAFEMDTRARQLKKHNARLKLHGQPLELLLLLVERAGEVVTRDEMRQRLWPRDTFVDFDNGVNAAVRRLRCALADPAARPHFIETLARVGYRFLAPVERVAVPAQGRFVLVVLPFENLSGDPSQPYWGDGLTDEIMTCLGALASPHLAVIARSSALAFRRAAKPVSEIGRELGADFAVEGTCRRQGQRLRITAQLVRARDQIHLWAQHYDREAGDLLAVQAELGRAIADQIQAQLGGPPIAAPPPPAG
ncbi:MAG TPA: winged helix-turn-helix domain-containing protein [Terriglobales bacterium]|nr:winged helix-turn-helix domain-containing protein [Terriglobales bacterium]